MTRKPRALRPGDLIGVAAPAGPVDEERLRRGATELERLGFAVRLGDGILESRGFTAGSVNNRVDQLHELFEDPEVAAVACARGGAGILHLLPHLDRELLRDNPKLLLGYSDVTLLHLEMERIGLASLHGPMIARELAEGDGAYDPATLRHGLTGEGAPYASQPDELLALAARGAEGVLRGGCLSLLAGAAGTPWGRRGGDEPTLLFLEDVDEKPYRVDRMLRQLRASGALQGVTGIVFGDMRLSPSFEDDYRWRTCCSRRPTGSTGRSRSGSGAGTPRTRTSRAGCSASARALECRSGEARFSVLEAPVE